MHLTFDASGTPSLECSLSYLHPASHVSPQEAAKVLWQQMLSFDAEGAISLAPTAAGAPPSRRTSTAGDFGGSGGGEVSESIVAASGAVAGGTRRMSMAGQIGMVGYRAFMEAALRNDIIRG